jgi:hypothetical protein
MFTGELSLVSDVFKREETNSRHPDQKQTLLLKALRNSTTGTEGIINSFGKHWKEQRRFMISTLRDFGFGKSSMEVMINEEVEYFVRHLKEQMKTDVSIQVGYINIVYIRNYLEVLRVHFMLKFSEIDFLPSVGIGSVFTPKCRFSVGIRIGIQ